MNQRATETSRRREKVTGGETRDERLAREECEQHWVIFLLVADDEGPGMWKTMAVKQTIWLVEAAALDRIPLQSNAD